MRSPPTVPCRSPRQPRQGDQQIVNAMQVAAPQQVMLEVRFLEVNSDRPAANSGSIFGRAMLMANKVAIPDLAENRWGVDHEQQHSPKPQQRQ